MGDPSAGQNPAAAMELAKLIVKGEFIWKTVTLIVTNFLWFLDGIASLFSSPEAEGVDDRKIGMCVYYNKYYEPISLTAVLWHAGIDIMDEVVKALVPVTSKWYEIGIILGLSCDELDVLKRSNKPAEECVRIVTKKWLKQKLSSKKFGVPSWKKLVGAIGSRTGGANGVHAREIAIEHPALLATSEDCTVNNSSKLIIKAIHLKH